jgi:hypothetical protein
MLKKLDKLTVVRSRWTGRDGYTESDGLLTKDGDMCCLGFYCKAQGIPDDILLLRDMPSHVYSVNAYDPLLAVITAHSSSMLNNTSFAGDAAQINDNRDVSQTEKEADLIDLFIEAGIELEFVD